MSIKKSHKNNKKDIDKIVYATYNSHINNKKNTKTNNQPGGKQKMKEKYRIVTEDGKEILRTETYAGCESYWNACNGIYEDESGEHYLSIEEIK